MAHRANKGLECWVLSVSCESSGLTGKATVRADEGML